jgi:hypothetical protein
MTLPVRFAPRLMSWAKISGWLPAIAKLTGVEPLALAALTYRIMHAETAAPTGPHRP